ncbi:hypothetical protein RHSIM_Rhsim09G0194800 [Rhododendron simsii]|uniref:Uncharacterized protein n=1 Tax=Rhododendron simsii TaxID=118357 RepID=A0A834GFB3_RHOSS|nr:hypothetical protein RHSIM_Rhsim09G0194800 [Rhododendron simsii]
MVSLEDHNVIQHKSRLGNGWARCSCSKCQDYVHMEKWRPYEYAACFVGSWSLLSYQLSYPFLLPLAFHSSRRRRSDYFLFCLH